MAGAFILLVRVTLILESPAVRTKSYFALQRVWTDRWPLLEGKALPIRLEPFFRPFVPVWVQVESNLRMLLDPNDFVSRKILETGVWEDRSWWAVAQHLQSGATFADVGAHIGYYSLKAAAVVGPSGHVIAIEPNPETIQRLRDNIRASGASIITVQPVACYDSEATLDLYSAPRSNTGESSISRINASQEGPILTSYRVRARSLDTIITEMGVSRVDVIKIDVEGAELMVLKGAMETLAKYRPFLVVELNEWQLRSMGTSSDEVIRFLHSHGYNALASFDGNTGFIPEKK